MAVSRREGPDRRRGVQAPWPAQRRARNGHRRHRAGPDVCRRTAGQGRARGRVGRGLRRHDLRHQRPVVDLRSDGGVRPGDHPGGSAKAPRRGRLDGPRRDQREATGCARGGQIRRQAQQASRQAAREPPGGADPGEDREGGLGIPGIGEVAIDPGGDQACAQARPDLRRGRPQLEPPGACEGRRGDRPALRRGPQRDCPRGADQGAAGRAEEGRQGDGGDDGPRRRQVDARGAGPGRFQLRAHDPRAAPRAVTGQPR